MNKELRPEILSTARALFNERGYNDVSMRDIAGALHISVGNLTYYFKTKKDLVEAVALEKHAHYREFAPVTDVEGLDAFFRRILSHQRENLYYFRHYRQLAHLSQRVYENQVRVMDDMYRVLREGFTALRQAGQMSREELKGQSERLIDAMMGVFVYNTVRHQDKQYECLWSLVYPLLTAQGKAACRRCMASALPPPANPQPY